MSGLLSGRRRSERGESGGSILINTYNHPLLSSLVVCRVVCTLVRIFIFLDLPRSMLELSWKYVDENWVGIPISKVGVV